MSPIFVRPVREQLEHDRLIRFLQLKYKRKFEALINVGEERIAPVKIGTGTFFPDLVLIEGKKLAGVVEVETGESVNNLEVDGAVGALRQGQGAVPPVRAGDRVRLRPTPVRSVQGARDGSVDLPAGRRRLRSRADVARCVGGRSVHARRQCHGPGRVGCQGRARRGRPRAADQTARCPQTRGRRVQKSRPRSLWKPAKTAKPAATKSVKPAKARAKEAKKPAKKATPASRKK